LAISIGTEHLKRYRDIAWLLWKHGRADWVTSSGIDKKLDDDFKSEPTGPDALADDLESLGPTFIKIGQMLASRADLLPLPYLTALSRLQDNVEPVPFEELEKIIVEELNARPSRIFLEIDPKPLATASLAQVHAAKLRDGRDVVVKVQRPGVMETVQHDFEAFISLAKLGTYTAYGKKFRVEELVLEFKRAIEEELDYRLEVDNLRTLRRNLKEFPHLIVPEPVPDFCSRRVLTMERIPGASIGAISPVVLTEVDTDQLAEEMFSAYLKQILIDGFFHADPHPGNILLTHDHRLGVIDLGMIGRVDLELQQNFLQLLIAISNGRGREAGEVAIRIGTIDREFERDVFLDRVSQLVLQNEDASMNNIEAGRIVLQIQQIAGDAGLRLPRTLVLVGKTLLNLDAITRILAPNFKPNEAIRRHTMSLVQRRMRERVSPGNLLQSALETSDFISQLPRRLNDMMTQIGKSGIKLDVDAFDEHTFITGFQKVANRITSGLILAALIIGAALLMRVPTTFTLFGYPGFAILLFVGAAIGGVALLYQVMMSDKPDTKAK
jgi:ubiquinone biosynthesis protein